MTNPYWILWWVTVGAAYVAWSLQNRRAAGLLAFYSGHELSDLAWYVVSLAVAGGVRFLEPGMYKGLLLICGLALLGLGAYFVFFGIRSFVGHETEDSHP